MVTSDESPSLLEPASIGFCPVCKRNHDLEKVFCPSDGAVILPLPTGNPQPDDVIGQRYLLKEEIGEGGMATVFRALDLQAKQMVAVKILAPSWMGEQRYVDDFFREARLMQGVSHANIVTTKDFGAAAEGYVYLVMDYLTGANLFDLLTKERTLPPSWAAFVALQVAEGLGALHERRIIHNDVKPENIHLQFDDDRLAVELLDFGIAHPYSYDTMVDGIRRDLLDGTPGYMSPEVIAGEPPRATSDLYSLGVILYEMLMGELPFDHPDGRQICAMHLFEPPPPCEGPPALTAIVDRLLRKEPPARYHTASALREELLAVTLELPPAPVPESLRRLQAAREAQRGRLDAELEMLGRPKEVLEVGSIKEAHRHVTEPRIPPRRHATIDIIPVDAVRRQTMRIVPELVMEGHLQPSMCWVVLLHVVVVRTEPTYLGDEQLFSFVLQPILDDVASWCTQHGVRLEVREGLEFRLAKETSSTETVITAKELLILARTITRTLTWLREDLRLALVWRMALSSNKVYFDPSTELSFWDVVRGSHVDMVTRVARGAPDDMVVVSDTLQRAVAGTGTTKPWEHVTSRERSTPLLFHEVMFT